MAIVGARACTEYGKEAAGFYAGELANAGVNIISGMAAGVDGYATEAPSSVESPPTQSWAAG